MKSVYVATSWCEAHHELPYPPPTHSIVAYSENTPWKASACMDDDLLVESVEVLVDDGSQTVVEEVTVDDVANEVIIHGSIYDGGKQQYAATTLRTNDYIRGRPRVLVPRGRAPKPEPTESKEEEAPPRLSTPDGAYATPSMRPLFKMHSDSAIKKAHNFFQGGASTSRAIPRPPVEEVIEDENVHQMDEEVVMGGELQEQLLEEHVIEQQQDGTETKEFYEDEQQQEAMGAEQYEEEISEWPMYSEEPLDFPEACEILLGNFRVSDDKVCKSPPMGHKDPGTFIVEGDRNELGMDGMGAWGKPSGRTRFYRLNVETNKYVCVSDARGQLPKGVAFDIKCQLRKYEHPTTVMMDSGANRFIKKIITCVSTTLEQSTISIITYDWVGTPFDFTLLRNEPRRTRNNHLPPPAPRLPEGTRNWEDASRQSSGFRSFPATCSASMGDCPLYASGAIQFQDVCHIIMGHTFVDETKICDRVPLRFRECGTFVVNVDALASELELRRDDNGQWNKPAGNSRYFKIVGDQAIRLDRCGKLEPGAKGNYDLQVLCKRYEHPMTGNRFVRKIYTGRTPIDTNYHETYSLGVITYFWKGDPIPFEIIPQRKVRVQDASLREMIKRADPGYEQHEMDEEGMMMGMATSGGGNMYMEQDGAFIEDDMPMRMVQPHPQPPQQTRKRRAPLADMPDRPSTSMASEDRHAGGHPSDQEMEFARMAFANQQRFAIELERLGRVADHMERMMEMQMNMMYRPRPQYNGEHGAAPGDHQPDEHELQYVEEDEAVYEMEEEVVQ